MWFYVLAAALVAVAALLIRWIYQPYKAWKLLLERRKEEAISIHTNEGVRSKKEHLKGRRSYELSLIVPSYN